MFDAKSLLDGLLQSGVGTAQSPGTRVQNAVSPNGLGGQGGILDQLGGLLGSQGGAAGTQGGGLGGLLASLTSGGGTGAAGGQGGGLGSLLSGLAGGGGGAGSAGGGLGGLLGQLTGAVGTATSRTTTAVQNNDPLAVGGLGAVAGALLGGRGGAVGGGLLAVLGSIAYSALQNAGQPQAATAQAAPSQAVAALPPGLAAGPEAEAAEHHAALLCLQAMISAAKADGTVDGAEVKKILGKLQELGADSEAQSFVMTEMQKPLDLDALVAEVPNAQVAVQVYAASLLAIEVDTPVEQAYLDQLAQKLNLPPAAVAEVHRALGLATA